MAIRQLKSGSFQVYWNNPYTGKREGLTEINYEEAKKKNSLIKHRLKYERESFLPKEAETKKTDITLGEVVLAYLQEKRFTKKGLAWIMGGMKTALTMYEHLEIKELTTECLEEVKAAEERKNVALVTVRGRMRVVYTLIRWAKKRKYIETVPDFPELPPAYYQKFVPPNINEIAALWDVAPEQIKRVIVLGTQLGIRIGPSEAFKLQWSDVDFSRHVVRVQAANKNPAEPWREVPIREEIYPLFQKWEKADKEKGIEYIINYKGKQVSSVKRSWQYALKKAGITRRIRPYDLRHAFATEAIANGADIGTVAKLMGHSSPDMVLMHYQHIIDKQKIHAVESLPHVHGIMCTDI